MANRGEVAQESGLTTLEASLLAALQRSGPLTAEDAAAAAGLSRTGVLRHLATLGRRGLIERRAVRGPVGRPRYAYDVTGIAQPLMRTEYERFSIELLDAARDFGGIEMVRRLLDSWRRQASGALREEFVRRGVSDTSLHERVQALAAWQERRGFMPEVQRLRGLRLVQRACPIRSVGIAAPAVCEAELALLADVAGGDVERETLIAAGDRTCTYRFRPRPRDFPGPAWDAHQMRAAGLTPSAGITAPAGLTARGPAPRPAPPAAPAWRAELMRPAPSRDVSPHGHVVPWPPSPDPLDRPDGPGGDDPDEGTAGR